MEDKALPFRIYENDKLLEMPEDTSEPLIEDFLYKNDLVMLIAEDKMGKTILSTQIAISLSSGTSLLGLFDIHKPCKVWYFAHEGKDDQLIDRIIRMNQHVPLVKENMKLFCGAKFRWNEKDSYPHLSTIVNRYYNELPDVIIVDPLYAAMEGDLNDNKAFKEFLHVLRCMMEDCGASVILVHHMKKNQRDDKGKYFHRTDGDAYGSAVAKWAVDHVFYIDKWAKGDTGEKVDKHNKDDKVIRCNTQRSGTIVDGIRMRLHEPEPLYFYPIGKFVEEKHQILSLLKASKQGMTVTDITRKISFSRATFYNAVKELTAEGVITKTGDKTKLYTHTGLV